MNRSAKCAAQCVEQKLTSRVEKMYDDIYALEEFVRELALEAHKNRVKCEHLDVPRGVENYAALEYAYGIVLKKIDSMRVNQRPHIVRRDIDYVF